MAFELGPGSGSVIAGARRIGDVRAEGLIVDDGIGQLAVDIGLVGRAELQEILGHVATVDGAEGRDGCAGGFGRNRTEAELDMAALFEKGSDGLAGAVDAARLNGACATESGDDRR